MNIYAEALETSVSCFSQIQVVQLCSEEFWVLAESAVGSRAEPLASLPPEKYLNYLHVGHLYKITFELKVLQLKTILKTGALET